MAYNKSTCMWEGYIYVIENDINIRVYVGQTIRNVDDRFKEHIKESKNILNQKYLHKAMRKYGEFHFKIREILKIQSNSRKEVEKDLDVFEQYYIKKFKCMYGDCGYNGTIGGHNHQIVEKSVDRYDLDGVLLSTYNSITEASFITGCSRSGISDTCNGRHVTCGGFVWRYHNDQFNKYYIENQSQKKSSKTKMVNCYSLSNQYIKTYSSLQEAADSVGLKNSYNITNVCMKRRTKAGGYIWYYVNDESQPDKSKIIKRSSYAA